MDRHTSDKIIDLNQWGKGFNLSDWSNAIFGEACSIEEYAFLFGMASLIRPSTILEIGTSNGLGSIALLQGATLTGMDCHVVSIDRKCYEYQKNLAHFGLPNNKFEFMEGNSADILSILKTQQRRFGLCLIDGGHDEKTIRLDWQYANQLSDFFIFHDSHSEPGVRKLVSEIVEEGNYSLLSLIYPPGHQIDDPTREWYQTLSSPGFCIVQKKQAD